MPLVFREDQLLMRVEIIRLFFSFQNHVKKTSVVILMNFTDKCRCVSTQISFTSSVMIDENHLQVCFR